MSGLSRRRVVVGLGAGLGGGLLLERSFRALARPADGDTLRPLEEKLSPLARRLLPDAGDAAAIMRLSDGRVALEHHPLVLRQRRMPPGSVMKLVTAVALLEAGLGEGEHTCTGAHRDALGIERPCWLHRGHGPMRLRTALAHSCNAWFYEHAQRLDAAHLLDGMRRFGLGGPFLTDLGPVATDSLPGAIAARDLPDVSVGDNLSLMTTPLSLLRMVSVVATRGRRMTPVRHGPPTLEAPRLEPLHLDLVAEGMAEAVLSGTLHAALEGLDVAAKTGTAKRPGAGGHRGLVVGFLPRARPAFAFVVVKDRGRGARDAGPAARALVEALREERAT